MLITEKIQVSSSQKVFNDKIKSIILNAEGKDFDSLSPEQQHNSILNVVKRCNNCKLNYTKFLPNYISSPEAIIISRAKLNRKGNMQIEKSAYVLLEKLLLILNINIKNSYYTNSCLCMPRAVNSPNSQAFKMCHMYKELELLTMNIPDIFILVGNDAFNSYFNKDCSVQKILGSIYVADYLGAKRLFIPIPHPVYLLRDNNLLHLTIEYLKNLKVFIDSSLEEVLR